MKIRTKKSLQHHIHHHKETFAKSTLTAIAASIVDFSTLIIFTELFKVYYVASTAIGAILGAITNFLLNRSWAFNARKKPVLTQSIKYASVSLGSLLLNTLFVFLFTEFAHLSYLESKIITAICVGWFWNYPLHKYFVFAKESSNHDTEK